MQKKVQATMTKDLLQLKKYSSGLNSKSQVAKNPKGYKIQITATHQALSSFSFSQAGKGEEGLLR